MEIPLLYNGAQLLNQDGWTEEDDWYIYNRDNNWVDIVNIGDLFSFGIYSASSSQPAALVSNTTPLAYTPRNFDSFYLEEGACNDACKHPFFVKKHIADEVVTYTVCTGMVNNIVPSNMDVVIGSGAAYVYISCTVDGQNYPVDVTIGSGGSIPADADGNSYIAIAQIVDEQPEQLVSSSLWTERFKCGQTPAKYWWSNV
jgi:hypothetical protein